MSKTRQTHFTTGEFAKLCNVKKQTLFHYDDLGIFSPDIKTDNNYRYYSVTQLEVFHVISALKELDMPLKDIKEYLDKRSPEELVALLEKEKIVIDQKIKDLQQMKSFITKKAEITKKACQVEVGTILLKEMEEEFFVTTKPLDSLDEKKISVSLGEHITYCETHDIYSPYSIGGMVSLDNVKKEHYWNYSYFYTKIDEKSIYPSAYVKEKGTYLITYHQGGYNKIGDTYEKILDYVEKNRLTIESCFYEDALLDDSSVKGYDNYLLQLSVKVSLEEGE